MPRAIITGTGIEVPRKAVPNDALPASLDTSDAWIRSRTGIGQRYIAGDDEQASDLAVVAAKKALDAAGQRLDAVELIVVATVSGDMPMPSTAAIVQGKLGSNAPAFDVAAACAGAVYALSVANAYIRAEEYRSILVIGTEVMSRVVNWKDRGTSVLFGDAAGAMLVEATEDPDRGVLSTHLGTDGALTDILKIHGGGTLAPLDQTAIDAGVGKLSMNGREVFKVAVRSLVATVKASVEKAGLQMAEVDHVVAHQANARILEAVMQRLGLPQEKAVLNIERYANTSAASIPVTLDEAVRAGRIQPGDVVAFAGIGAGMTWGSLVLRY